MNNLPCIKLISRPQKIPIMFQCYDLLGEGHLRRETMYQLMKKSLAKSSRDDDVEEAVKVRLKKETLSYRKAVSMRCSKE